MGRGIGNRYVFECLFFSCELFAVEKCTSLCLSKNDLMS